MTHNWGCNGRGVTKAWAVPLYLQFSMVTVTVTFSFGKLFSLASWLFLSTAGNVLEEQYLLLSFCRGYFMK